MKRIICILLVCMMLTSVSAFAAYDFSAFSDEDLILLYDDLMKELGARNISVAEQKELHDGLYVAGQDLQIGIYKVTCKSTEAEDYGNAYSSLGNAYSAFGQDAEGLGSLMGALGNMMGELSGMKIEIVGDYGTVIKSYELKPDETVTITLNEGNALKVSEGSCTIEKA